jgi:hypothetical protein
MKTAHGQANKDENLFFFDRIRMRIFVDCYFYIWSPHSNGRK